MCVYCRDNKYIKLLKALPKSKTTYTTSEIKKFVGFFELPNYIKFEALQRLLEKTYIKEEILEKSDKTEIPDFDQLAIVYYTDKLGYSKSQYKALYDKVTSGASEPKDIDDMCKIKDSDALMALNGISPQDFPIYGLKCDPSTT